MTDLHVRIAGLNPQKTCLRCGVEKPLADFPTRRPGRTPKARCRKCVKAIACGEPIRIRARVRNVEAERAQIRRYRERPTVRERLRDRNAEWHRNRLKSYAKNARRRAKARGAYCGEIDLEAVVRRDRSICYLCDQPVPDDEMSFDHVVPLVRGGVHIAENLRVAHITCNQVKGALLPGAFEHKSFIGVGERRRRSPKLPPTGSRTHCPKGHPYDAENTYRIPSTGARCCRICRREFDRRRSITRSRSIRTPGSLPMRAGRPGRRGTG